MKFWPPSLNRKLLDAFIFLLISLLAISIAGAGVSAETNSLAETLIQAGETTPELREEREQVAELEREIEMLKARAGWQIFSTGSYRRGEEETTIFPDDSTGNDEPGEPEVPEAGAENNGDTRDESDNDTELESFESLTLGLGINRAFMSGLEIDSEISYLDQDPIDTDDISENLTFSLEGSYQLWPRVPAEPERSLQNLKEQLFLAEKNLDRAREDFYLELLRDYLEIAVLQEEIELTESQLDLSEERLERARARKEMEEAGELEVRELELAVKQAENGLNTLTRNLSTARENFRQKLAEAEEPAYNLNAELWQMLENKFGPEVEVIDVEDKERERLLERKKATSVEFSRLEKEKDRLEREFDWYEDELQPNIDISAGSQDIEAGEWQAAINVNYALYQGGQKELEAEDFAAEIASLQADMEDLNFALSQQLQALMNEIENNIEAEERAELELERSELELEKEKLAYDRGAVDELELEEIKLEKQDDLMDYKQKQRETLLSQIDLVSSLDYLLLEEVLVND